MTRALLYKEFRETLPIAVVGLACLLLIALDAMAYSPLPGMLVTRYSGSIPFLGYNDGFANTFGMAAGCFALALGFWHSLGDFWCEAHLFYLHRPVTRRSIYSTKLVVGLMVYLICGALPILLYAGWAATPGTHASPFEWSMTFSVWNTWLAMTLLYLGAFLSGIRPAAWIGTRLVPLAAAGGCLALAWALASLPGTWPAVLHPLLLVGSSMALVIAIVFVAEQRDFS